MIATINKPERVFGLQVRCRELDIFQFLGIFWEIVWNFYGFFEGIFRNFFAIFLEFFWNFLENFFCVLYCWNFLNMKGIDLFVKILVFVKILSQGRRKEEGKTKKFRSLEVREASSSHLKNIIIYNSPWNSICF